MFKQCLKFGCLLLVLCVGKADAIPCGPHRVEVGPEWYHLKRTREGGSKQTGDLHGIHATYDRAPSCGIYWGADGYAVTGDLSGKTAKGFKTKSNVKEREIEGRLGYTRHLPYICWSPRFTLFMGGGYYYSSNKFRKPSPMTIKMTEWASYGSAGCFIGVDLSCRLRAEARFTAKFMANGKSDITEDHDFDDISLDMDNEVFYNVDIPISYRICESNERLELRLVPFYRFRHFGGRSNFPFDFVETKFRIYGARVTLAYQF